MFKPASFLALLALTACGGAAVQQTSGPPPDRPSDGSTTTDLAMRERDSAAATARLMAQNSSPAASPAVTMTNQRPPANQCSADRIASALTVQQALALVRPAAAKDQFESTEAYRARAITAARASFERQGRNIEDLAVIIPLPAPLSTYDADKQELQIGNVHLGVYRTSIGVTANSRTFSYIPISETRANAGTYTGSNAFGARTEVVRRVGNDIGLIPIPEVFSNSWPTRYRGSLKFTMSPDEARRTKPGLAILLIGSLDPPFVETGRYVRSATFRSPFEVNIQIRGLVMRHDCIAFVDRLNNRVLSTDR